VVNGKNASEVDQQDQFVEMVNVNQEKAVVVVHKIVEVAEAVEVLALKFLFTLIHPILLQIKSQLSIGK
jgi:hypothetical protein